MLYACQVSVAQAAEHKLDDESAIRTIDIEGLRQFEDALPSGRQVAHTNAFLRGFQRFALSRMIEIVDFFALRQAALYVFKHRIVAFPIVIINIAHVRARREFFLREPQGYLA